MKSLKKVLALTSVVAMLGSYAAGAASVTIANKDENGYIGNIASGNIAIDYTYTPDAGTTGNQVTIIAFEDDGNVALDQEVPFAEGKEVAYINQIASEDVAEGATTVDGNFTFAMRSGLVADLANGEYFNVFVGGTNVATADRATFSYGTVAVEEPSTTYSVSGTVSSAVNFGSDDAELAELTAGYASYVEVWDVDMTEVITTVDIDSSVVSPDDMVGEAAFTVEGLEKGVPYILVVGRPGVCPKLVMLMETIEDDVTDVAVDWAVTDVDADYTVSGGDVVEVVAKANAAEYDPAFDAYVDVEVNGSDVVEVVAAANAFDFDAYTIVVE